MHVSTVILVSFLTAAGTSAGTVYVLERYGILPSRTAELDTMVPDLRGLSENDARANAGAAHIALLVASREASADAKPGAVLRQSIAAGQHVSRDYSLSVVLADEVAKVPSIIGLSVADATQRLELRGYNLQLGAPVPDPAMSAGLVAEQAPKADAAQARGAAVTVHVSSGPAAVELPKVVGVAVTKAQKDLEQLGVKPVVRWVAMAETPTYVVLRQSPAPGEKVPPGSEVQLTACR